MLDGNQQWVRLLETPDGMISIVPRADIEKRFDGYALIQSIDVSNDNAPSIHFAETNFQTNVTGIGQQVKHAYSFTNTGKQPLKVSIKSTSCGCTSAFIGKGADAKAMTIAPGISGSVQVSMDVNNVGTQEQMVTLETNDPQRPLVYLTIVATSPQNIEVSPTSLFLNSDKGQAVSRDIQIVGPASMKILSVETNQPDLTTDIQNGDKNSVSHTWKINVARSQNAKVGDYKATISIRTDNVDRPLITIPVTGKVTGDLNITPPNGFFGFVKAGQSQDIEIILRSRSGKPFQILGLRFEGKNHKLLKVTDENKGDSVSHHLKIALSSSRPVFLQEQLVLETNIEGESKRIIPITGLIQE